MNNLQDANNFSVFAGLERAFGQRSGASLTLGGARQVARDPGYSNTSGQFSIATWRVVGRTTLTGSVTYQHLESDRRLAIYPQRRKDDFLRASLAATLRSPNWKGRAPQIKLVWEKNWSPIEIYRYDRWRGEFGITRAL